MQRTDSGASSRPSVLPAGAPEFAVVTALLALPLLIHAPTAGSVAAIWNRSDTYAHGYTILPIALYLIWRQRRVLAHLTAGPDPCAFALVATCGALWFAAELADVPAARQYALALALPFTVIAVLGNAYARALRFPLLFVLFAVPFGEFLVPYLIEMTAGFTVAALHLSGVPVLREGNLLVLPSGNWSVVEACSGVRYLVSSVTLGALFAHLSYRSRVRQLVFVCLSAAVPLLANGVRAYGVVMLGHLSGMRLAVGVDHVVYGWIFFALVMLTMLWVGARWREDGAQPPAPESAPVDRAPRTAWPSVRMAACCAAALWIWPWWTARLERDMSAQPQPRLVNFAVALPAEREWTDWQPAFGQGAQLRRTYRTDHGVGGAILLYYRAERSTGARLVTSTNRLVDEKTGWIQARAEQAAAGLGAVTQAELVSGNQRLLVWTWYRVGGASTTSGWRAKLLQVRQRLTTGRDDAVRVVLFAPADAGPEQATAVLTELFRATAAPLDAVLAANRKL